MVSKVDAKKASQQLKLICETGFRINQEIKRYRPVYVVVTVSQMVREVWGSIFGPLKSDHRVTNGSPPLQHNFGFRSCAAQTQSRADRSRHSLHDIAECVERNFGPRGKNFVWAVWSVVPQNQVMSKKKVIAPAAVRISAQNQVMSKKRVIASADVQISAHHLVINKIRS